MNFEFIDLSLDDRQFNNNTLKRVSNENKDRRENFIIKPVDGERGSITFFDFTDYETFSCTKMGVLYDILNALHDEFGKYIRVKFKQYSIDEVLEYKRASLELYKDIVKKEVLNSGINIVDAVHSETSEDYLQDVADGINKIIPEAKCSVGKRLSKKKLNVRYIHDKSFYSDSEVDPHQESMEDYVVQHITVENFKHQSSAAVYNILKELVIKKDIATGKITLVDWSQYGYKADWLFGVVVDGTVFKSIESLGGSINSDLSVRIRGDIVRFRMVESQDQVKHEMTKQEAQALVKYNDDIKNHRWASKPQIRKYDKVYNGKLRIVFGERSYIRDNDSEKLEDRLGDILVTLYEKAEENRIVREAREEAERKRVEEARRREENRQRKEQEIRLVKELVNKAEDYRIASYSIFSCFNTDVLYHIFAYLGKLAYQGSFVSSK